MVVLKKNLFGIGLAFSMVLGIAFSFGFAPQDELMMAPGSGGRIPCSSNASSSGNWYVDCSSCTRVNGTATGGSGKCRRN